jgi:hypothetical protein
MKASQFHRRFSLLAAIFLPSFPARIFVPLIKYNVFFFTIGVNLRPKRKLAPECKTPFLAVEFDLSRNEWRKEGAGFEP